MLDAKLTARRARYRLAELEIGNIARFLVINLGSSSPSFLGEVSTGMVAGCYPRQRSGRMSEASDETANTSGPPDGVERRSGGDRRKGGDRRVRDTGPPDGIERRKGERRKGERRET
jgi:hypothetical protein